MTQGSDTDTRTHARFRRRQASSDSWRTTEGVSMSKTDRGWQPNLACLLNKLSSGGDTRKFSMARMAPTVILVVCIWWPLCETLFLLKMWWWAWWPVGWPRARWAQQRLPTPKSPTAALWTQINYSTIQQQDTGILTSGFWVCIQNTELSYVGQCAYAVHSECTWCFRVFMCLNAQGHIATGHRLVLS